MVVLSGSSRPCAYAWIRLNFAQVQTAFSLIMPSLSSSSAGKVGPFQLWRYVPTYYGSALSLLTSYGKRSVWLIQAPFNQILCFLSIGLPVAESDATATKRTVSDHATGFEWSVFEAPTDQWLRDCASGIFLILPFSVSLTCLIIPLYSSSEDIKEVGSRQQSKFYQSIHAPKADIVTSLGKPANSNVILQSVCSRLVLSVSKVCLFPSSLLTTI